MTGSPVTACFGAPRNLDYLSFGDAGPGRAQHDSVARTGIAASPDPGIVVRTAHAPSATDSRHAPQMRNVDTEPALPSWRPHT